jgi:hypothetical protein
MPHLSSTIDFIKNQVFPKGKILSQEMVISDDKKVLALCDLSSENAVMEIKTFNVVKEKTEQGYFAAAELTDQLYYEKRGRAEFVLSLTFDTQMDSKTLEPIVTGLSVVIIRLILLRFLLLNLFPTFRFPL